MNVANWLGDVDPAPSANVLGFRPDADLTTTPFVEMPYARKAVSSGALENVRTQWLSLSQPNVTNLFSTWDGGSFRPRTAGFSDLWL